MHSATLEEYVMQTYHVSSRGQRHFPNGTGKTTCADEYMIPNTDLLVTVLPGSLNGCFATIPRKLGLTPKSTLRYAPEEHYDEGTVESDLRRIVAQTMDYLVRSGTQFVYLTLPWEYKVELYFNTKIQK